MAIISMLLQRALHNPEPPGLQTKHDMNPTLLVSWWCTGFALAAILVRVSGRYIRTETLFREDKIMFYSIIPLLIRMGLVHVILIWGTNNTVTTGLTPLEIRHREIGSKLVLVSRIFYAAFIWIAKYTVVEFLKRLIGQAAWHKSYEIGMRFFDGFLAITFVAVVVSTLSECHPFSHYWQVVPDPGPYCREGIAQLITMGVCDILTDVILISYPIPLVVASSMTTKRKINLILLFLMSLILIAITLYRVPSTISRKSSQQYRSLLASLEILAASGVANAIVIGSFLRDRGVKKAKFRSNSVAGSSGLEATMTATRTRTMSVAQNQWGSDEDLARELGMSLHPSLQARNNFDEMPRVAPVAPPYNATIPDIPEEDERRKSVNPNWNFQNAGHPSRNRADEDDRSSVSTASTDLKLRDLGAAPIEREANPGAPEPPTSAKMSFFDVGGLVESSTPPSISRDSSIRDLSAAAANQTATQVSRASSRAFLSDIGGLLSSHSEEAETPTAPVPGPVTGRVGSFRNFSRGGSTAYSRSSFIPEQITTARRSPRADGVGEGESSQGPSHQEDPDDLSFSDAGGLLR